MEIFLAQLKLLGKDFEMVTKGQLNSEWIYEVIVSPKIPTKNLKDFCPGSLLEWRAEFLKFLVGILGQTMTSWIHSEFNWPLVANSNFLFKK